MGAHAGRTGGAAGSLDHSGHRGGSRREIGLAAYLDGLTGPSDQRVSIGMATVAMMLDGIRL